MDEKWPVWLFSYDYSDGQTYTFNIPARTKQEALDRVRKLAIYARCDGELMAQLDVPVYAVPATSVFVKVLCWWKNFWR